MKKLVIFLSAFLLLAGVVSAAGKSDSQKISIYHVDGGSSDSVTDELYKGHVTLVTPMGKNNLILQGVIQGLVPNVKYFVWVRDLTGYTGSLLNSYAPLGYYKLTLFTTDEFGNGDFHYSINKSWLPARPYSIQVAINREDNGPADIGYTVAATKKFTAIVAN